MAEFLQPLFDHYTLAQWAFILGVTAFGSVVQGTVGFASGMIVVPLLVVWGVALHEAAAINFLLTAMQNVRGAWRLRHELTYHETNLPLVLRWIGIPVGAMALAYSARLDQAVIKQLIGGLLLVIVVVLSVWKIKHREHIPLPATIGAFLLSGFLLGFAAIGGAPMVLYVNALTWSAAKCRAFLFYLSATGAPPMAAMLIWNFGAGLLPACLASLVAMPLCWLGVNLGIHLGRHLDKNLFRKLTFGLLALIAISSLLSPWLMGK
ncbi:Sulfite exporter TauE/SafE [Posidoniimonas polymericola]|uniref:Probable membrane transporter protein n=1 Tax=Posidoniimonas polymericola TaxID=2528002 RepID=A0A5C5YEQ0_9BACT|nr:sulfite exporter TauE/SafE family protein [Posidoniimonas polymericola]TWT73468.1 Sulfite exporter TauE/SafE [Posidoniimonas polymericola]